MSLVNDMLRDLDQRRKSSDSSSSVNLMPASDMPVEKKNRILLIISVALVLAVSGLAYLWSQQSGVSQPRQLNISPSVATAPSTSPAVADPSNTSAAERAQELVSAQQAELSETEPAAPVARNVAQQTEVTEPAGQTVATVQGGQGVQGVQGVQGEGAPIASRQASAQTSNVQEPAQAATGQNTQVSAVEPATESRAVVPQSSAPSAPTTASSPARSVINQPPQESVKNDAQMSADQRDTMAVQAALRMIADNNMTGAYAHLEQHILQNRYAHQSRETYAKLLMNQGELLAAYNLVESGLGLAPNHPGYKKVKARILIADGQISEAVGLLASRAPSIEDDLEYHEILATAQLASRDYRGALLSYESLVQQDQSQGKWWYGYAASQDSLGNIRAARQAYNRAVQQASLSPNLRRRSQERLAALSDE